MAGTFPGIPESLGKRIGWRASAKPCRLFHVKHSYAVERFVRAHGWPPGANRDEVVRRIEAWDAQVAEIKRRHAPLEQQSCKQQLLPFSQSLTNTGKRL